MTLYTAIGVFGTDSTREGRHPVVMTDGEKKLMDIPEMVIWATLNYRVLTPEELEKLYQKRIAALGLCDTPHSYVYIDRLLQRGLIAEGQGDHGHDALYDLLCDLHIVPAQLGLAARIASFLKRTIHRRLPLSITLRELKKPRLSSSERDILDICGKVRMSVAEVIICMENGHRNLASEEDVVSALYCDDYTTSSNIGGEARSLRCERPCLTDIANLYLRQFLLFESCA